MGKPDSDPFNPYAAPLAEPEAFDPFQQDDTRIRQQFINCEANVTTIAGVMIIGGLLVAAIAAIAAFVTAANSGAFAFGAVALLVVLVLLGFVQMVIGARVRTLHPRARIGAIIFCTLWLFFIPLGTIFGGACLWYLVRPAATYVFTPEYRDVIRRTPHVRFRTSAVSWGILATVLLGLLGLVAVSMF
ncbi:MAG: hypothetical protein KDB01_20925 [Planctomycetaceae bacterium]|nr:hypothetical protein [Planctomycetaceae bacterium]